jgi:hypothetical protein
MFISTFWVIGGKLSIEGERNDGATAPPDSAALRALPLSGSLNRRICGFAFGYAQICYRKLHISPERSSLKPRSAREIASLIIKKLTRNFLEQGLSGFVDAPSIRYSTQSFKN